MKDIKCRVYAAGGTGMNLGTQITSPTHDVCYIDTSSSNLSDIMDADKVHKLQDVDGSGKNRKEHYDKILPEMDTVMDRFPPAIFNIVLFSAAGGSGSVIGPLVLKALLQEGHAAIAVVVGSDESSITVTNTINTLKSLESISAMTSQPVIMAYHENTTGVPIQAIDDEVLFVAEALGELANQNNHGLDTQDLVNWVQYPKVAPGIPPQLSALAIFDSRQAAANQVEPIAIASLYEDPSKNNPFGTPYYTTVGYPRETSSIAEQLHFVINTADIEETFTRLSERQIDLNKVLSGYRQRRSRVDVDDNLTGDGLVL